jgi:hypothetical protein
VVPFGGKRSTVASWRRVKEDSGEKSKGIEEELRRRGGETVRAKVTEEEGTAEKRGRLCIPKTIQ